MIGSLLALNLFCGAVPPAVDAPVIPAQYYPYPAGPPIRWPPRPPRPEPRPQPQPQPPPLPRPYYPRDFYR
jgi:hypothetical protein